MRKLTLSMAGIAILAIAVATATAASPPSAEMLKFFTGGTGTIAWSAEGGSSTESDQHALKLVGTTQGVDYSGAYAINATSAGTLLADFNASFDVKGYMGAGSPRISLPVDTDGDGTTDLWAYLSAVYAEPTGTQNGFTQVDFQESGSTIYTSTAAVLHGLSDSINATGSISYQWGGFDFDVNDGDWQVATDNQPFLILDEAPAVSFVDNLTIGGHNWTRPGANGFVSNLPPAGNPAEDGGTMHWDNGAGDSFDVDVHDVIIDGNIVAFSGRMENGTGQWAGVNDVIQEHINTETHELHGKIGGTDEAPQSISGFDGPFSFTGTVSVS